MSTVSVDVLFSTWEDLISVRKILLGGIKISWKRSVKERSRGKSTCLNQDLCLVYSTERFYARIGSVTWYFSDSWHFENCPEFLRYYIPASIILPLSHFILSYTRDTLEGITLGENDRTSCRGKYWFCTVDMTVICHQDLVYASVSSSSRAHKGEVMFVKGCRWSSKGKQSHCFRWNQVLAIEYITFCLSCHRCRGNLKVFCKEILPDWQCFWHKKSLECCLWLTTVSQESLLTPSFRLRCSAFVSRDYLFLVSSIITGHYLAPSTL